MYPEGQYTLNRINAKETVARHLIVKLLKIERYREKREYS